MVNNLFKILYEVVIIVDGSNQQKHRSLDVIEANEGIPQAVHCKDELYLQSHLKN